MSFINLGIRNEGAFWEYGAAYSFLHTQLPSTRFAITKFLGIGDGPANKHCHDSDVIATALQTYQEVYGSGLYTPEFFASIRKVYTDAYAKVETLCSEDMKEMSDSELGDLFFKVTAEIMEGYKPMLFGLFSTYQEDFYTEKIRAFVGGQESVTDMKSVLLTTQTTSFGQQEEGVLFSIEQLFLESGQTVSEESFREYIGKPEVALQVDRLVADFGWFHMEYASEPMSRQDYVDYMWDRIKNSRKVVDQSPAHTREVTLDKQRRFFEQHSGAKELEGWTRVLQELATIFDDSKAVTVKGIFAAYTLYVEVAHRLGITRNDLLYLVLPEAADLLSTSNKADPFLIETRKEHCLILLDNGTIEFFEEDKAMKLAEELLPEDKVTEVKEVKGIIAYPGKVTGRVTGINFTSEKVKFKSDDVMVTRDGTVELTVFLREAAAIVTDEDGMICHAAIVGREMKTPCVVGTRKVTKVFKDGDTVEVDATTEIIRKVS